MNKAINQLHKLSKEVNVLQEEHKALLLHQQLLQYYALMMYIAINEGKTTNQVCEEVRRTNLTPYLLQCLAYENKLSSPILISNRGDCLNNFTGMPIESTAELITILEECKSANN